MKKNQNKNKQSTKELLNFFSEREENKYLEELRFKSQGFKEVGDNSYLLYINPQNTIEEHLRSTINIIKKKNLEFIKTENINFKIDLILIRWDIDLFVQNIFKHEVETILCTSVDLIDADIEVLLLTMQARLKEIIGTDLNYKLHSHYFS